MKRRFRCQTPWRGQGRYGTGRLGPFAVARSGLFAVGRLRSVAGQAWFSVGDGGGNGLHSLCDKRL